MNTPRFRHGSLTLLLLTVPLTGSLAAQADSLADSTSEQADSAAAMVRSGGVETGAADAPSDPNLERRLRDLRVGSRVRVTMEDGTRPRVGRVDALYPSGLRVGAKEEGTGWIPADAIRRLEVSLERRSFEDRVWPGALVGGLLGTVTGILAASMIVEDCSGGFCFDDLERFAVASTFGIGGLLVGGAISLAAIPAETWAEARLPGSVEP